MSERSKNPYINADGSPLLLRSVVVFIDILGYKDLIEKASLADISQDTLIFYRKALDDAYEILEHYTTFIQGIPGLKKPYEVRGSADSIVIGYPIGDNRTEDILNKIFSLLAHVQLRMIFRDYFLRGAISIGELYLDDTSFYGAALLEAQDAEKNACNPRIILTMPAKQQVNEQGKNYLLRDADDQFFLNYLEDIMMEAAGLEPSYQCLFRHKEAVERNLEKNLGHPKNLSKYLWVANYHNYFCEKYQYYFADSYKIDLNKFQIRPIE